MNSNRPKIGVDLTLLKHVHSSLQMIQSIQYVSSCDSIGTCTGSETSTGFTPSPSSVLSNSGFLMIGYK